MIFEVIVWFDNSGVFLCCQNVTVCEHVCFSSYLSIFGECLKLLDNASSSSWCLCVCVNVDTVNGFDHGRPVTLDTESHWRPLRPGFHLIQREREISYRSYIVLIYFSFFCSSLFLSLPPLLSSFSPLLSPCPSSSLFFYQQSLSLTLACPSVFWPLDTLSGFVHTTLT